VAAMEASLFHLVKRFGSLFGRLRLSAGGFCDWVWLHQSLLNFFVFWVFVYLLFWRNFKKIQSDKISRGRPTRTTSRLFKRMNPFRTNLFHDDVGSTPALPVPRLGWVCPGTARAWPELMALNVKGPLWICARGPQL